MPRVWRPRMPRLLVNVIVNPVLRAYATACHRLIEFSDVEDEPIESREDLDRVMTWHMDHMAHEQHRNSSFGKTLKAGVEHFLPGVKCHLPHATRAPKGWEKLEGEHEKEPLCLALNGIAIEKLGKIGGIFGWAGFSQSRDGIREEDVTKLRAEDIFVGGTPSQRKVSLHLGVAARGETTKRGASQGVEVLEPELIRFYIEKKEEVGDKGLVFDFPILEYQKAVRQVLSQEMGLLDMEATPHLFRHSCAIYCKHYEDWGDRHIQERLRHGSERSTQHYKKVHLPINNEGRCTEEEQRRGLWLWEDPSRFDLPHAVPQVNTVYPNLPEPAEPSTV